MTKPIPISQRHAAASTCKPGDTWANRRDGARVTIAERIDTKTVRITHKSGRKTVKQLGNLADDYIPVLL